MASSCEILLGEAMENKDTIGPAKTAAHFMVIIKEFGSTGLGRNLSGGSYRGNVDLNRNDR